MAVTILFSKEQLLVDTIVKRNPGMGVKLQAALKKIYVHLPGKLIYEKYDPKIVEEFLRQLIRQSQKLGLEKYFSVVTEDDTVHTVEKRCLAPDELLRNMMKSLGSYSLTKLIADLLQKMATANFTDREIENLASLVEGRNRLRQAEERFLRDALRAYLEKKISFYS